MQPRMLPFRPVVEKTIEWNPDIMVFQNGKVRRVRCCLWWLCVFHRLFHSCGKPV